MPAVLTDFEKQVGTSWLKVWKFLNSLGGQPSNADAEQLADLVGDDDLGFTAIQSANEITELYNNCKIIGNYVVNRSWPANNDDFDRAFETIAENYTFINKVTNRYKTLNAEQLARVIAKYCSNKSVVWSIPRHFSTFQLDNFTNDTVFGKALKEFGCIEGIDLDANTVVNASSATPDPANYGTPATSSPVANSGKPVSVFKSQGSLAGAGEIRDLKNPKKEYMTNCYKIVDKANTGLTQVQDKQGNLVNKVQTEFRVFINPFTISYKGKKKGGIQGPNGLTNVVRLGSSKDYIDCVCYFKDRATAQAFADKVMADINANKIILTKRGSGSLSTPDLEVVPCKNAKAGYFEVGTVYGNTYIVAPKANESLETEGE